MAAVLSRGVFLLPCFGSAFPTSPILFAITHFPIAVGGVGDREVTLPTPPLAEMAGGALGRRRRGEAVLDVLPKPFLRDVSLWAPPSPSVC